MGKKYVNEPELWKKTEDMVRKVLIESGINYVEVANEAAFYGPKIDVQVWSAIGREFTIATNQVDFAVPAKFGLTYRDKDNSNKTPLCIHRAPLGTHERFIGFLIEHYAGNFPLWLAPDQVRVITLNDDAALIEYAKTIVTELRANMVRVEPDFSRDAVQSEDRRRGKNPRSHDAGHRRSRHGSGTSFRALAPRRPARREAEGGSRGGYSGEHQRAPRLSQTKRGLLSPKNQLMKMIAKRLTVLSLVSLAAVAGCHGSAEAEKTKADAKAAAEKTADTAKDVVAEGTVAVKEGLQKAGEVATNVAAKVKSATTNLVSEVKEKVHDATK